MEGVMDTGRLHHAETRKEERSCFAAVSGCTD
jgi:hypothetical protein